MQYVHAALWRIASSSYLEDTSKVDIILPTISDITITNSSRYTELVLGLLNFMLLLCHFQGEFSSSV